MSGYVILGAGEHATVCQSQLALMAINATIIPLEESFFHHGIAHLARMLRRLVVSNQKVVIGVGRQPFRRMLCEAVNFIGIEIEGLKSSTAIITSSSSVENGVQVLTGAYIGPRAVVGSNTIINTRVVLEHDSLVGSNCHLAPNVTVCGGCHIKDSVQINAGSVIGDHLTIAEKIVVGMGSVVTRDLLISGVYWGAPARFVRELPSDF